MRGKVKAMARALAFSGLVLLGLAASANRAQANYWYCIQITTRCMDYLYCEERYDNGDPTGSYIEYQAVFC